MNRTLVVSVQLLCLLAVTGIPSASGAVFVGQAQHMPQRQTSMAAAEKPVFIPLPGQGKKCWIGDSLYFVYKFNARPKMGTTILKVQVFDKKGKKLTRLSIAGSFDMPSMRGAHDSGDVQFKLNKKGDYLLPVNVVMPGGWEVNMTFSEGDKPIYRGSLRFEV